MNLVIGATGTVGRGVVAGLRAAGAPVRAFTRDPARAGFGPGVEVAQGDLGDPESVLAALDGAAAVFVATSPDALEQEAGVAAAVRKCGTPRVVQLSSVAANDPVMDAYGQLHAAAERAFAESGTELTVLRPAGFMSNTLQWRASIAAQGKVFQPYGSIPRALVDPADIAAVAVAALTGAGHGGRVYQVTGGAALTAPEVVAEVSAGLGRPLRFVEVDPEQARAAMEKAGMPAGLVAGLLASMADGSPGRGGRPLPTVREVLGREPRTFGQWFAEHRSAFE
jgi:uncharacterized protein YbjT (DUF2867 family)